MKEMYKVVTADRLGYNVTQQDGFETLEDAQKDAKECIKIWGEEQDFWVEPYIQEPYKEARVYDKYGRPNAVDGWEDLYPLDED
jgi:hypothetical protein